SGGSAPGRRGGACRSATVHARPFTTVSSAGGRQGLGQAAGSGFSAAYDGDIVMIDSSCVRVHQHGAARCAASPAGTTGARTTSPQPSSSPPSASGSKHYEFAAKTCTTATSAHLSRPRSCGAECEHAVSFDLGRMPYLVCGKAERSQRHRSVSAALGYRSFLPKIPSWSVRKPCLRHQLTRPVPTGRSQPPGENGTAERERGGTCSAQWQSTALLQRRRRSWGSWPNSQPRHFNSERSGTWVTVRTGHMGNTSPAIAGEVSM